MDGARVDLIDDTSQPREPAPRDGPLGTVGFDRRLVLHWDLNPAYTTYEIHESTSIRRTPQGDAAPSPRTSDPLTARPTPLRYGVRAGPPTAASGRSAARRGAGPELGGTVTVTDRTFELSGGGSGQTPDRPDFPGDLIPMTWKLTTTLGAIEGKPMEVWPDGRESNGNTRGNFTPT